MSLRGIPLQPNINYRFATKRLSRLVSSINAWAISDTGVGVDRCPVARYKGERIAGGRSSEDCERPRREGDGAPRFSTLDNCCRAETLVICFKLCGREIRDEGRLALLIVQKFQVNIVK